MAAARPTKGRTAAETTALPLWVGVRPHRVWVGPRKDKGGVIYLRWWSGANWRWKSLQFTIPATLPPAERRAREQAAYQAAVAQYERLTGRRAAATGADGGVRTVRLADVWAIVTDPKHGRWPSASRYTRELADALATAARYLGEDFPVALFDRQRLREVTRAHARALHARGRVGFRSAEILGGRLITLVTVLRDEGHLPADYVPPGGKSWKPELRAYCEELRGDALPAVQRPRYTLEEFRKLLAAAPEVDPRYALMFSLGAELRPAQVARARRSHLTFDEAGASLVVHGKGKKGGTTVDLTRLQLAATDAALAGYLAACEAAYQRQGTDYLLFPSELGPKQVARVGHARHVERHQVADWQHRCEALAGVPHVPGRAWYGARRLSVDAFLDAGGGTEALEVMGGWSSARTPTEIYRERGRPKAREESRTIRALVRGEEAGEPAPPASMDALVERVVQRLTETVGDTGRKRVEERDPMNEGDPWWDGYDSGRQDALTDVAAALPMMLQEMITAMREGKS